jgi:hypothetical protein
MERIIRVLAILCVVVGAGVTAATAQLNPAAKVSVPFSFNVGSQRLEAGQYNVRIVKSGVTSASLTVQRLGTGEHETVLVQSISGEASDKFKLVFGEENGNKFLAGISTENGSYLLVGGPEKSAETLTAITGRNRKSKM